MSAHGGLAPAGAEANANIALRGAETAKTQAGIPGEMAGSDAKISDLSAQHANQYIADPTQANWDDNVALTKKYKGSLAAAQLDNIKDPDQRMALMKGHVGGGLTAEQAKPQFVSPESNPVSPTDYLAGRPSAGVGGGAPNTPQSVETQKQTAAKTIDYLQGEGHKSYANAQAFLGSMQTVDHALQQLGPAWVGPGSQAKTEFVNGLNSALNQFGIKPISADAVGNAEVLGKEANRAGMQLISSQFGMSREAAQTIQTGIKSVVSQGNSYTGAKMLSETLRRNWRTEARLRAL